MAEPAAFSVAQVAANWGVSTRLVYDLCSRGELGHLRVGGLIRVRRSDLEAYETRQWHAPSSNDPTTGSPNEAIASMSVGGKTVPTSAFQRGRLNGARLRSGLPSS